jgi:quaternary ammonium compound-resistance protein SugE
VIGIILVVHAAWIPCGPPREDWCGRESPLADHGAVAERRSLATGTLGTLEHKIMAWIQLVIAGLLEIGWAIGLKYTDGFSKLWPSVATIAAMIASFALLAAALKTIPVGTGYAVWTGIGASGTAIIGMVFLGESRDVLRMVCLVLIVAGVVGLKFASPSGQ